MYVGQRQLWAELDLYLNGPDEEGVQLAPLLLLGETGAGKSACLANWTLQNQAAGFVLPHFTSCSAHSADPAAMMRRVLSELQRSFNLGGDVGSISSDEMAQLFPIWIERAAAVQRVVLILDGVDELIPDADPDGYDLSQLAWLPLRLPPNSRIILSAATGSGAAETLAMRGVPSRTVCAPTREDKEAAITRYPG